jgi:signal peptidase II
VSWVVLIALAITGIDQLTKWLVATRIEFGDSIPIIDGLFNLVHWRNPGAAWGMFQDHGLWLILISLLTILALYLFRHSFQLERTGNRIALGLIGGGILGNLIDRIRCGAVVDFLDFYAGTHHWPAFNVADSAICTGVALYVLLSLCNNREPKPTG